jgi:outer membrane protein OmpA-like peptidoglycan-associated protein
MFETFSFPKATVTAQLTPEMLEDLAATGDDVITLPVTLDLHGVKRTLDADVSVRLNNDNRVIVSSERPVVLKLADFNLLDGVERLQDAAEVTIVPTTAITFTLAFDRNEKVQSRSRNFAKAKANTFAPDSARLSQEACMVRFETISRSGTIQFENNSAALRYGSANLLNSVADIASKCPGMVIEVSGHTDSAGNNDHNLRLSELRAQSVVNDLRRRGVAGDRFISRGYGEARPIASNSTDSGRRKNRRIEFSIVDFR